MFTEAVDNFVDNRGLLSGARRAVLPRSELPPDWAKKYSLVRELMRSREPPKHAHEGAIFTILAIFGMIGQ